MKLKFSTFFFLVFFLGYGQFFAQSTVQDFPTSVTTNEIIGKINARDIGDSRLTSYFYTFNGTQGDLFVNVETNNLNADFDIFTMSDLRPLTKIVVYAGNETTETGRVVFLRKNEKLLLRIKGRTPNDDAGTYKIKFAGSFVAIADGVNNEIELPTVKKQEETDVKVNSVGTIIEVKPKPTPAEVEKITEDTEKEVRKTKSEQQESTQTPQSVSTTGKKVSPPKKPKSAPKPKEVTAETKDNKVEKTEIAEKPKKEKPVKPKKTEEKPETAQEKNDSDSKEKTESNITPKSKEKTVAKVKQPKNTEPQTETENSATKALENIKLIVLFKDGTKFERRMDEVNRVGVDKGILTIVTNKGEILRYSILEVEKMTIE
ncbi:MAG: hypothetical protein MUC29_04700 [Pyrinomonadaceae bacterium]|nr:hypothetical protein [Pyrinomonadaceae bacterium]